MLNAIKLLGVKITNEKEEKVLEYVFDRIKNGSKKLCIVTPNPEFLVYANSHLDYKDKLNSAEVSLPDGIGLLLAAKLMGKSLKSRITGTDFMEKLCAASKDQPMSIGFLGGRGGVADKTAERLKKKYPWIKIGFVGEEWTTRGPVELLSRPTSSRSLRALDSTPVKQASSSPRSSAPSPLATPILIDILFVAYGFPKQEEWIYENLEKLPIRAAMGVGGAFDYISGRVPRAPLIIRKIGLEWLFRLVREPWRWKRQLALIKFLYLILKEKIHR